MHILFCLSTSGGFDAFLALWRRVTALNFGFGAQSGDTEKDKLRASLGSAILAERPNVKVSLQAPTTEHACHGSGLSSTCTATLP